MSLGNKPAEAGRTASLKQEKMYGKIGKRQDQDKLPPEDRGQQGADFGGIGNEALTHYLKNDLNLFHAGSNEANNGNEGGQESEKAAGTALR